jgi:hypothetical protein
VGEEGLIIRVSEEKGSLKMKKINRTQINGKCNDTGSITENK